MKKRALALLCALALVGTSLNLLPAPPVHAAQTSGTTYYISSIHGDNKNAGTSESTAWETLDKLVDLQLKPGDQVLLEKGSVFQDSYIHLQDVHGSAEAPIRISSYGMGTAKPAIHANGQGIWYQQYGRNLDNAQHRREGYVSSTILLYDVDFVEVSDLELTNISDDFDFFPGAVDSVAEASSASADKARNKRMDRTGVAGIAKNGGTMEHVYLDNLYIHDVDGNIGDKHMDNGGIQMNVLQPENEEETGIARYHDVRITNCYVRDVSRAGICVGYTYQHARFNGAAISDETAQTYGHTGLLMENNYVKDIGNDGIVAMYAYRPLVQNNVSDRCGADMDTENGGYASYYGYVCAGIWPWKCKDGLFQYNEGFDMVDNQDGMPWDIDYSDGTVYQYNYSHNNGGGCIMFCGGEAYNGVFRYNISQNDLKGQLVLSGNPTGQVYNNVFYLDGDLSTKIHNPNFCNGTGIMRNNIFYNISSVVEEEEHMDKTQDTWENNIFYGYDNRFAVGDLGENNLSADPKFVNPGQAPTDVLAADGKATIHTRDVYNGYKLQDGSPAINAGVYIKGTADADFFGNAVGLQPDIGAFESDTAETEVALNLQIRGGTPMVVKSDKVREVEKEMTAGELKKYLVHAKGSSLAIIAGNQSAVADDAVVDETMRVRVTGGGSSKDYGISLVKDYWEYAPASMTATAGSRQDAASDASKVLDGNLTTMWHTTWAGCTQNEVWIRFDLGEEKDVAMLKYVARNSGVNGIFEEYKIEVSNDDSTWAEADRGTWSGAIGGTEYAKFDSVRARYVKLSGLKTKVAAGADADAGKIFGTAAEIRIGYEDDGILVLRAKSGSGLTVADNAIQEVPLLSTVQELKEKLEYSNGAELKILKADGQEAADTDIVRSSMTATLSRGEDTQTYTISLAEGFQEYDPASMTATAGSVETAGGASQGSANLALDNNLSTMWHTAWAGCNQNEVWIQLDLQESKPVSALKYIARSDADNGIFEEYKIEVSDDAATWTEAAQGTWSGAIGGTEYAKFDTVQARYVKLIGIRTIGGKDDDAGKIFGSAAEIRVGNVEKDSDLVVRVRNDSPLIITDDEICEVPKQTSVQALKELLICPEDAELKILGKDGQAAADGAIVANGMTVSLTRGSETKTYTIAIVKEYEEYDPSSMTATAGSVETSSATEGSAGFALDNNLNTIWHTAWAGCQRDKVWIQFDLGEVKPVSMVKYVAKQSGGANGIFKKYKVQVSEDGANWTDAGSGTWSGTLASTEYAKFDTVQARYVKLLGEETTSLDSKIYGSAAEIRIGYEVTE